MNDFIDDAFGAADFERTSARLTQDIQDVSRANYTALHNQPGIRIDDELREFLDEPLIARQLPAARDLARADGASILDNALSGDQIRDTIDNAPPGRNVADQFTTRAARDKLNRVLGDDRARRFLNEMKALDQQSRTRNAVLSGSRTTPLAEEIAEQREFAETAANIATMNIRGLGRNVVNRLTRGISSKNSEATLRVLLESDPNEVRSLMKQIAAAQQKIRKTETRAANKGAAAGSVAGQQAGTFEGQRRAKK